MFMQSFIKRIAVQNATIFASYVLNIFFYNIKEIFYKPDSGNLYTCSCRRNFVSTKNNNNVTKSTSSGTSNLFVRKSGLIESDNLANFPFLYVDDGSKYVLKIASNVDHLFKVVWFKKVKVSLLSCATVYEQCLARWPFLFYIISLINSERFGLRKRYRILYSISVVVFIIVCALYAGTLVTSWTTALNHQKRRSVSALLAAICFVLATLTITARCYASKNAKHPLAQLSSEPQFLSSIKYSKFQTYSSKVVLSRLFNLPFKDSPGDTSIILKNSKKLLFTKNFKLENLTNFKPYFRKRRESNPPSLKAFYENFITNDKFSSDNVDKNSLKFTQTSHQLTNRLSNDISSKLNRSYSDQTTNINRKLETRNLKNYDRPQELGASSNLNNKKINISDDAEYKFSANVTKVSDTFKVINRNDQRWIQTLADSKKQPTGIFDINRPMPPALDHSSNSLSNESAVLVLVVTAVVLTVALGLVTCVLSHYRGGTAADPHDAGQTPTTAPMLSVVSAGAAAGVGGMDRLRGRGATRELAATRDHQVRLHAVHTDIAINLPPNITLPDGEDHPYTNSRLHIRDPEQESEIYQKCIKPPPNRTVLESESPPPYRSSSAGLLGSIGSSSSGSSDWSGGSAPLVMRCHSMSSTSKRPEVGQKTDFIQRTVKIFTGKKSQTPTAPTLPVVVVPTRLRQPSDIQQNTSSRHKPNV